MYYEMLEMETVKTSTYYLKTRLEWPIHKKTRLVLLYKTIILTSARIQIDFDQLICSNIFIFKSEPAEGFLDHLLSGNRTGYGDGQGRWGHLYK